MAINEVESAGLGAPCWADLYNVNSPKSQLFIKAYAPNPATCMPRLSINADFAGLTAAAEVAEGNLQAGEVFQIRDID